MGKEVPEISRFFVAQPACSPPPSELARNLTMLKILHNEVEEIPWNKEGANSSHGNAW